MAGILCEEALEVRKLRFACGMEVVDEQQSELRRLVALKNRDGLRLPEAVRPDEPDSPVRNIVRSSFIWLPLLRVCILDNACWENLRLEDS
jgi:hypothetical protein